MRLLTILLFCAGLAIANSVGQSSSSSGQQQLNHTQPLQTTIERIDITDAIFRDGISELSLQNIKGLHIGFEEVIRQEIQQDPRTVSPHFDIHLQRKTVREILDTLCEADPRYTWSQDGPTVNIYPREVIDDQSYLFNLRIDHIALKNIPDPDQALTPLSDKFREQQVGYFGPGLASNTYPEPWTTAFEAITVRQFINRIAEHIGPQTSWVWEGGKNERMFTFLKGGFHTFRPSQRGGTS